jgi:hypothetical protein
VVVGFCQFRPLHFLTVLSELSNQPGWFDSVREAKCWVVPCRCRRVDDVQCVGVVVCGGQFLTELCDTECVSSKTDSLSVAN